MVPGWSVMSSAPFVPPMNSVPFCTCAVVAAVAWATREAERGRGEHARSERARPSGCVQGVLSWGGAAMLPGLPRERNARVFTHRPEELLALG